MDAAYWNEKAGMYEEEIFNVWRRDRDRVLKNFFDQNDFSAQTVMDCGCGIGHGLEVLAVNFRSVIAVDISRECLAVAQNRYGDIENIKFYRKDLCAPKENLPIVDCVVCVNALIAPSMMARVKMLNGIRDHLKAKGRMVLVVPSLESYYYAGYKLTEWKLREGERRGYGFRHESFRNGHGVVPIDEVLTKHYLKEELASFLKLMKFHVRNIEKVRYDWDTEYEDPPDWMQAPYPWDWMCEAVPAR